MERQPDGGCGLPEEIANKMVYELQRAVISRLKELDRNPFEAARLGGLERSFVNDILIGRKRSVRGENLERLARALDWDSRRLMDAARRSPSKGANFGWPSPRAGTNLDLFDVDVLRIGFSASLVAAGVSAETARQLTEGWLEFARKRPDRAEPPSRPDQTPTPESDGESYGQ
jgi:hypothetical protein